MSENFGGLDVERKETPTSADAFIYSKATGCALEPSATKDRGCAANHGSHKPSDYRGWSENTFKSYDTNP